MPSSLSTLCRRLALLVGGCTLASIAGASAAITDAGNPFGLYVVELATPPALESVQSRAGFNARSAESVALYWAISSEQNAYLAQAEKLLGREVTAVFRYATTFNGVALKLSEEEADKLQRASGGKGFFPAPNVPFATDSGPRFIGAPAVWNVPAFDPAVWNSSTFDLILKSGFEIGEVPPTPLDPARLGAGAVVGVIDSGINLDSPAFADRTIFGYVYPPSPKYGRCRPNFVPPGTPPEACNNKIIGAWDFIDALVDGAPNVLELPGVEDENGHGSHTASTAAGNIWAAPVPDGGSARVFVSGVAPLARLFVFDTCFTDITNPAQPRGLCSTAALLAAIDTAGFEGVVDVLNYSISSGDQPWQDAISRSMLTLENVTGSFDPDIEGIFYPVPGILVSASAGNSGPAARTVNHQAPWVMTVAASTHDRAYFRSARVSAIGPVLPPPAAVNIDAVASGSPAIVGSLSVALRVPSNPRACTATGTLAPLTNAIALIERGDCAFSEKVSNAAAAGAVAVVIYNNLNTPPFNMAGLSGALIPAVMISQTGGQALAAYIAANPTATGSVTATATQPIISAVGADQMAAFSSRGPSNFDVIKPDISAPGVAILAASAGPAESMAFLQGTSMAAPHATGAAALLRSVRASLRSQEIRSALALTATSAMTQSDGVTPTTPFDRGSGRIRVDQAERIGLVMDESVSAFIAANPDTLGSPIRLNTPSLGNDNCSNGCRFTRQLRSVAPGSVTWTAAVTGVGSFIFPNTFTLAPGQEQTLQIDFSNATVNPQFYEVTLTPNNGTPVLKMPVALGIRPPTVMVTPTALAVVTSTFTEIAFAIRNLGGPTLTFAIENSVACSGEVVPWISASPMSATLGPDEVAPVALRVTANGLGTGIYRGQICVITNDASRPSVPVTIELTRP